MNESERIDYLTEKLKIIQSREVFSFSIDAVLLANFAKPRKHGRIVDLCSGNGVIPLLLTKWTKAHIYGVELQERLASMAERSVALNELEEQITIVTADLKDAPALLGKGEFDLVTVNPPYLPLTGNEQNLNRHYAIARRELKTNLAEVLAVCSQLLKVGGRLVMVHRASRLADILVELRAERLEPKRIRFVQPNAKKKATMVLVEAIKNGGKELHVLPPLIVYESPGIYSEEIMQIYFGDDQELGDDELHYVYILKCRDGSYYTGYTNNLDERISKHQAGKAAKYTRGRLPVELIYYEELVGKSAAMKREVAIKRFTRAEKEKLVRGLGNENTEEL